MENISTVLITIQSILDNKPLLHEPGVTNTLFIKNYNKVIEYENILTLFLKNTFDIPEGFEIFFEAIKGNMNKYKEKIYAKIEKNIAIKESIKLSIYNLDYLIDYTNLKEKFKEFIN